MRENSSPSWLSAAHFGHAQDLSQRTGKPILLHFYAESHSGPRELRRILDQEAGLVQTSTIPVHINTENPSAAERDFINNHIFIWSPTLQLVAPDGSRYHEFNHAPRHTRHSVGYRYTHQEVDGSLTPTKLRSQLKVGLAKQALLTKAFDAAHSRALEVVATADDEVARAEATNLASAAAAGGLAGSTFLDAEFAPTPLASATARFCQAMLAIPEDEVMADWRHSPGTGDWRWYTDCLREVVFQFDQKLVTLSNEADQVFVRGSRHAGFGRTRAILKHHHVAYRELQADFIGVPDALIDELPLRHARSLRENVFHCMLAEWWAHGEQIRNGLVLHRKGQEAALIEADQAISRY